MNINHKYDMNVKDLIERVLRGEDPRSLIAEATEMDDADALAAANKMAKNAGHDPDSEEYADLVKKFYNNMVDIKKDGKMGESEVHEAGTLVWKKLFTTKARIDGWFDVPMKAEISKFSSKFEAKVTVEGTAIFRQFYYELEDAEEVLRRLEVSLYLR